MSGSCEHPMMLRTHDEQGRATDYCLSCETVYKTMYQDEGGMVVMVLPNDGESFIAIAAVDEQAAARIAERFGLPMPKNLLDGESIAVSGPADISSAWQRERDAARWN